ncbi:hypothetical protein C8Q79DRAFT_930001 [Trametes meyenii]|nr:hypothetical protein C8Q79DRAFT_930001 [Trametes meyenii]
MLIFPAFVALALSSLVTTASGAPSVVHVDVNIEVPTRPLGVSEDEGVEVLARVTATGTHTPTNGTALGPLSLAKIENCDGYGPLILKAVEFARTYLDDAVAALAADPEGTSERYRRWFGEPDEERYAVVRDHFARVRAGSTWDAWTYRCEPVDDADCLSGDGRFANAYVDKDVFGVIHICEGFFDRPLLGGHSMASIMVHEATHFDALGGEAGGTDDFEYGTAACARYARDDPDLAVFNAASYEFFASDARVGEEGVRALGKGWGKDKEKGKGRGKGMRMGRIGEVGGQVFMG